MWTKCVCVLIAYWQKQRVSLFSPACLHLLQVVGLLCATAHSSLIISIYPLTVRVVGAPQMISQPVSSIFPCSPLPSGTAELQVCPFPDVVFPPLPLSALSSSLFHCALQHGFGQTWWTGDTTIPLQFASLYNGQEVFVWSDCLLDLGTDFLVGNMVFVWDA